MNRFNEAVRSMIQRRRPLMSGLVAAMGLLLMAVSIASASPPSGVTPTVLARGTYDAFKVTGNPAAGGLFKAEAKAPIDVVVRRHEYLAGASTGWHAHPYPVLITVIQGTLTFYERDDPTCTPKVVHAGEGYTDSGRGHIGRNETGQLAVDISVIMAPVGAAFRTELSAPSPYCGF
jgi:quercetin dioxygenase-like cupin family protein